MQQNSKVKLLIPILLGTIFAYFLTMQNITPYLGIVFREDVNGIVIDDLYEYGWGINAGLKKGDKIILIDDKSPTEYAKKASYNRVERVDEITIYRNGDESTYHVNHGIENFHQYLIYFIIPTSFFLICLILCIVLYKKHSSNSAMMLIYLMMSLSICYISTSLNLKLFFISRVTMALLFPIAPIFYLHFVYYFMKENKRVLFSNKIIFFLYGIAILTFVIRLISLVIPFSMKISFTFVFLFAIITGILVRGFWVLKNDELKMTYSLIVYSFVIGIAPFVLLYLIPLIFFNTILIIPEITALFIFVVPVLFLFLITSGKLYVIKLYIKKLPYYFTLSFFVTIVIFVFFYLLSKLNSFASIFWFVVLTNVTIVCSFYIKNYFDRVLRSTLFVEKYYYQKSLYRFSERIKQENNIDGIKEALFREMDEVLNINNISFVNISKSGFVCIPSESFLEEYKDLLLKVQQEHLQVGKLIYHKYLSFILIGERENHFIAMCWKSLETIKEEQEDWISTLAYYSSISLENMYKVEELLKELKNAKTTSSTNWLNRLIFSWSEEERKKLASDIHDTFLQDIIIVKRKVDGLKDRMNDKELIGSLSEIEETMEDVIFNIRETCHELTPPLLTELGLQAALKDLVTKFNLRSNIYLSITIEEPFEEKVLTIDFKRMIYRTVQELLTNAIKHSQASEVKILLETISKEFFLSYSDNGVGFNFATQENDGKSMGLIGIKERIHSFGGKIDLKTKPGEGLQITSEIPVP